MWPLLFCTHSKHSYHKTVFPLEVENENNSVQNKLLIVSRNTDLEVKTVNRKQTAKINEALLKNLPMVLYSIFFIILQGIIQPKEFSAQLLVLCQTYGQHH